MIRRLFALVLAALVWGCAASGPHYIDLAYTKSPGQLQAPSGRPIHTLGISRFTDSRNNRDRGYLGFRTLNDSSREVFLVRGLDLAGTLTDLTWQFMEQKGIHVLPAPDWSAELATMAHAARARDAVLTGRINTFECRANKTGALTQMVLTIDLTLFLGRPGIGQLTTIPVALTLERTDLTFTRKKLASFFNDTLAEVLEKALAQFI